MLEHIARGVTSSRRDMLGLMASGLAGSVASSAVAADTQKVDFADSRFNVRAFARLSSTLESGKTGYVRYTGKAFGLSAQGVTTPFYGIDGIGAIKALPQESGAIRFLFAEFAIYTDLKSGEPLEQWTNPWSEEKVAVWHQRNGPVNYEISPGPSDKIGKFDKPGGGAPAFTLPWMVDGDRAMFALDVASKRPNPLDPKLYPLESAGEFLHISEHSQYLVSTSDLANSDLPSLKFFGALQSLKPWHPWMKMGQTQGKVFTRMIAQKVEGPEALPANVRAFAERKLPQYMAAPESWTGQYVTAYDLYKQEFPRKP
jgi:Protein of unknown function (DUF1838)